MSFSKFDHLRHRQFLVIEMLIQPPPGTRTERKGWKQKPHIVEKPYVATRINANTLRNAAVIIDLANNRVIKNRLRRDAEMFDDEALAHYKAKYPEMWASR